MDSFPDFSKLGFQVKQELGHNRVGGRVTYLAKDIKTEQLVVIKQFQFAKTGTRWTDYEAYQREIQVLRGLQHPGIPQYLSSFQTDDGFCMVQEYKEAISLGEPRSFHFNEIQQIAIAALKILVYLQNRVPPVIHRDIKPENILVDQELNVYLVDFGFARIGDGEVGISSVVKGTLGFMPPEQLFNRELTEASDLYGLGVALICLLTGTKSTEVGNLIDITYRVNFKHLVPKLSISWVNWLEKLVEPRLKDRFPNAIAALEAMPAHEMRPPEVKFNRASLDFVATRAGEQLTQVIEVTNTVPETLLEGRWEVAPHTSDPPHTPSFHVWISPHPMQFESNKVQCHITVDTSKLMPGKVYNRQILLHTNAFPKTNSIALQVRTVAQSRNTVSVSLGVVALLFAFSFTITWFMSVLMTGISDITQDVLFTSFGFAIGSVLGFETAAWGLATAGAMAGATAGATAGILTSVAVLSLAWFDIAITFGTPLLIVTGIGFLNGMLSGISTGTATESLVARGRSKRFSIVLSLLVTASAAFTGLGFVVGFLHPLLIVGLMAINVPLGVVILHSLLRHTRQMKELHRSQHHLIKP